MPTTPTDYPKLSDFPEPDPNPLNRFDVSGRDPLRHAIRWGTFPGSEVVLQTMIDAGARVDNMDANCGTPLSFAVLCKNASAVTTLLKNGADLDAQDAISQFSPLMTAAMTQQPDMVKLLLDKGASPLLRSNLGKTALHFAMELDNMEVPRLLLAHEANINEQDKELNTPLMLAVKAQQLKKVQFLIDRSADLNISGPQGRTALFTAVQAKDVTMANLLLNNGAEVNVQDEENTSPLMIAAKTRNLEMVRLLVENGAKTLLQKEGKNVMEMMSPGVDAQIFSVLEHAATRESVNVLRVSLDLEGSSASVTNGTNRHSMTRARAKTAGQ